MGKKDKEDESDISKNDLKLRIQKKLASGMVNKSTLKTVMSEEDYAMLETLYQLMKVLMGRKDAKKLIDNIIKIVTKIFLLQKNNKFKADEEKELQKFDKIIFRVYKAAITFWDSSDFADVDYFVVILNEGREIVSAIAKAHLTPKSQGRVTYVFDTLSNTDILTKILISPPPEIEIHTKKLSSALRSILENRANT